MSEAAYMVVFRGELMDGADAEQVKERLESIFKLTREKVEELFSLSAVVLKKNLTHELAHDYKHKLAKIGVCTEVSEMASTKVIAVGSHSMPEAVAKAEAKSDKTLLPVQFNGEGGEYFKIWIVNILLTIVTLGIYSAWAKVRNHRYFYSNTEIDNATFEYTADPVAILKGRVIAVIFLLLFNYAGTALPFGGLLYGLLSVVFVIAMPWLICRSMAFRNRNTVYRNVRFGFDGQYMEALKAFILWPIAGGITLGLLIPHAIYKQKSFLVNGSRYGTSSFGAEFQSGDVFRIAFIAFLLILLAIGLFMIPVIGMLLGLAVYLLVFAFFSANMTNLIYNNSHLHGNSFESTFDTKELALLYFTNWLIVAFTLGLGTPWAKVRLARYKANHTVVVTEGALDDFIATEEKQINSLGEEIGEAFDVDIGL